MSVSKRLRGLYDAMNPDLRDKTATFRQQVLASGEEGLLYILRLITGQLDDAQKKCSGCGTGCIRHKEDGSYEVPLAMRSLASVVLARALALGAVAGGRCGNTPSQHTRVGVGFRWWPSFLLLSSS
jgi:hypothetical protein